MIRALVVIAFASLAACGKPGSGKVADVEYRLQLPGSYSLAQSDGREDVWLPSTDDRPIVSIRVLSRPQMVGKGPSGCDGAKDTVSTSSGGFFWTRRGDGVELKSSGSSDGAAVHFDRCVPPGERGVMCMANYSDGKMSDAQTKVATQICRSLTAGTTR